MNPNEFLFFSGFLVFIFIILAIDLGIFNKKDHVITTKEALSWTCLWIVLAFSFYLIVWNYGDSIHGVNTITDLQSITTAYQQKVKIIPNNLEQSLQNYRHVLGLEYLTGYIIEESLSVDNIFVIILIFSAFRVEKKYYHRVLFWGIIGALIFRFIFIFTGAYLVSKFSWVLYLFAAFLIYTGFKFFFSKDKDDIIDTHKHPIVKFMSKYFKITKTFDGNKFFVKDNGQRFITPLFLVLLIVEFSDLIFAVDSIPAIFAVTKDPYIIFFSNIFAILGLRSLFFVLLNILDKFHYFKLGLALILIFIGIKMIFEKYLEKFGFTLSHSLIIILAILLVCIATSLIFPKKQQQYEGN